MWSNSSTVDNQANQSNNNNSNNPLAVLTHQVRIVAYFDNKLYLQCSDHRRVYFILPISLSVIDNDYYSYFRYGNYLHNCTLQLLRNCQTI